MKRIGRWLRRLAIALPLAAAACASSADNGSGSGSGPSTERRMDILAIVAGSALIIGLGTLMYIDNQD